MEKTGTEEIGAVIAVADGLLRQFVACGHPLRVYFQAAFAGVDVGSRRAKARAALRLHLLRGKGAAVQVDDYEFLTSAIDGGALQLRDASAGSFDRTGKGGYVAHAWDGTYSEYLTSIRPSALLLFVPSSFSAPPDAGAGRAFALHMAEVHYAVAVQGRPVFLLMVNNPTAVSHGLMHGFVLQPPEAPPVLSAATVCRITGAHAALANLYAQPAAANAPPTDVAVIDAAAAASPSTAASSPAAAAAAGAGAAIKEPELNWAPEPAPGAVNALTLPPLLHRFKPMSAYDAEVSSDAWWNTTDLAYKLAYKKYPSKAKEDPGVEKKRLKYVQRQSMRQQEKKENWDKIKMAVIGGPVRPREVKVGPPPSYPDADSRHTQRMPLAEAVKKWDRNAPQLKVVLEKGNTQEALRIISDVEPQTLAYGGGVREADASIEAREFDLMLVMKLSEVHDRRYDAIRSVKTASEEQVCGIVAEAYVTLERTLREFAPSVFGRDGIVPAQWPWDRSAADLMTSPDLLPVPRPEDDFLFQPPRVFPSSTGAPAPVFALALRLLRLAVNDALALALLTRYYAVLQKTLDDWDSGAVRFSKSKDKDLRDRIERALKDKARVLSRPEMMQTKLPSAPKDKTRTPATAGAAYPRADSWSLTRFQLRMMGQHMPRPMGRSDGRVPFRPDDWQRRLLDVVDARENAMVVAVTSAGKTFICFRAMEQVLHEGNDGVVVYVGPSAALVQQVADEARARFEKAGLPSHMNVAGVLTKERRTDVTSSQVVAATPESLEATLTSAVHAGWARRIRWVIFDEVHNIVAPSGHEWERLLLAVDAPILALSATVGGVHTFKSWLSGVVSKRAEQASKRHRDAVSHGLKEADLPPPPSPKLHLVTHMERWNGLNAQIYVPHDAPPGPEMETAAAMQAAAVSGTSLASGDDVSAGPQPLIIRGVRFYQPPGDGSVTSASAGAGSASVMGKASVQALPAALSSVISAARTALASGTPPGQLMSELPVAVPAAPAGAAAVASAAPAASAKKERRNKKASSAGADGAGEEDGQSGGEDDKEDAAAAKQSLVAQLAAEKEELKAAKRKVGTKLNSYLQRLHPVAAISRATLLRLAAEEETDAIAAEELASEIAGQLLPEDAISLYDTLEGAVASLGAGAPAGIREGLAALEPHAFFATEATSSLAGRVTMRRAGEYATALVTYLGKLAGAALPAALAVVDALAKPITASLALSDAWIDACGGPNMLIQSGERVAELLLHLDEKRRMPAIVFNTSQAVVETMARQLGTLLSDREKEYKRILIDSKRRDAEEKAMSANQMAEDMERNAKRNKKPASIAELRSMAEVQEAAAAAQNFIKTLKEDPEYVEESFTFRGPAGPAPKYDVMRTVFADQSRDISPESSRWALLRRGIGIHHPATPAGYRRAVEFFFRTGQLGVVFSTDTLAQGINMPCRSVVLAGHSPDMTSLLYRQMAGRAGRRGYDLRGDVVHFGMPSHELEQLALAPLPLIAPTAALDDPAFWGTLAVKKGDVMMEVVAAEAAVAAGAPGATQRLLAAVDARTAILDTEARLLACQQGVWASLTSAQKAALAEGGKALPAGLEEAIASKVKPLQSGLNSALGNAGLLRRALLPGAEPGKPGRALILPTASAGLLPLLLVLGPSALALAHLLQRGALQGIVEAVRSSSGSNTDADNALMIVLTKLIGRTPAFRRDVSAAAAASAGEDGLGLAREEAASAPGSMRSGKLPAPVQAAVVSALGTLAELGSTSVPGLDATSLVTQPSNPYLLKLFAGAKAGAVRKEEGVSPEDMFNGGVALINSARALGYALAARVVEAGVVRLEPKDPAPPGMSIADGDSLSSLLRDCELTFGARFVSDFEDEIAGAEAELKLIKRSYGGTNPRPTEPFDVFQAAFLDAAGTTGTTYVARDKATPAQLREINTAVALFGLASRFRSVWARRTGN